jgi:hypothetical protein
MELMPDPESQVVVDLIPYAWPLWFKGWHDACVQEYMFNYGLDDSFAQFRQNHLRVSHNACLITLDPTNHWEFMQIQFETPEDRVHMVLAWS